MKTQLLLAVGIMVAFMSATAQKPDTAWLMVHYKFSWVQDTANRAHPYTENMALFVGKRASAYISYDGLVAGRQFKKAYAEAVASSPDGQPNIVRHGVGTSIRYYQYPTEGKMFTNQNMLTGEYAVEDAIPAIDWKITGDTATFGGLHCQEATGHFMGRDYIAWFCPDLPVHTGPWKLNGLPGVIVDAHDTKDEVVFQFDGVEKTFPSPQDQAAANTDEKDVPQVLWDINDDPNMIKPPARAIRTSRKEFDKMREAVRKNPDAVLQAINSQPGRGSADKPMIRVNKGGHAPTNPMELPEK